MHIFKSIYKGHITLEDVEKEEIELRIDLGCIKREIQKINHQNKKKTINNIKNLYNSREEVAQIFNDYAKNMSQCIFESKQGTGLKILSPKQMIQRLPLLLCEISAGNNSERFLNEIRQIG